MSFEEALDEITFCLGEQWFWIMTKIDVKESMQKKLWKEIENYMILWACNPQLAYEALEADYEIGLVMPCNVIVYEKNNTVFVSVILPTVWSGFVESTWVQKVAVKAEELLKKAVDNLEG